MTAADRVLNDQCDVFVSFSRDMAEWAAAIESTVDRFRRARGLDLRALNWRDIDPLETTAASSWQDLVGAPSELGARICIVLIGERIGSPLPPDFKRRHGIAERMAANGIDWVRVPGVHPEQPGDARVPLTGLLFELFDAMLPPAPGGKQPELFVVLRGTAPENGKAPHFGAGAHFQTLSAISDGDAHERAVEEYMCQRAWLKTVYARAGLDGKRPTFWVENIEQLRERTRRILEASFGSADKPSQDLPGLMPYGVEHSDLFLGRTTERTFLLSRVFPDRPPEQTRRLLLLKGPSGSGKSSMLRACLLAAAHERFRRDQGWRTAFLSLAEVGHSDTLLSALAQALAKVLPSLNGDASVVSRLDSDPGIAGAKLIDHLIVAAKSLPSAPPPKLLIVIDQLEIAFDQVGTERESAPAERAFIDVLAALGSSAASGPLAEAAGRLAAVLPVTIVVSLPTDRLAKVEAELKVEMGADLNVSAELGETAVREIIVGTFERLGIAVPSTAVESMVREGLEAARESPVQPLIAIALRSLQQRWEELGRPSAGLSEEDVATYGRLETAISGLGDSAWAAIEATAAASVDGATGAAPDRSISVRPLITTVWMPAPVSPAGVRPEPAETFLSPDPANVHGLMPMAGAAQSQIFALLGQMFGAPTGPMRPPVALQLHDHDSGPAEAQDTKRSLDPDAGLDNLLLELTRVRREQTSLFVALRSVREEQLDRHGAAVAREMLNHRLLWRLPDGSLRLVHERVLGDWKPANAWLEREGQGLHLLTRLEDLAEKRLQHLEDTDTASADALLELGKSFPQALLLWAFRRQRLPQHVIAFLDAVMLRECSRPDRPDRRHDLLWIATVANRPEGVKQLLAAGAEIRPLSRDGRELAGQVGARWPLSWGESVTPLHLAALCGDPATLELLMAATDDANAAVEDGWRPLHLACVIGWPAIVQKLASAGAPLDAVKADGLTALHLAALNRHEDCVEVLLRAGASPNAEAPDKRWSVAHAAAKAGHVPILRRLMAAGADITARDANGWQPVHTAAGAGNQSAVEALLDAGVSLECQAGDGHTVLGEAVHSGNVPLMRALIERGASLTVVTASGKTHLHCAAETGNVETVRLLLDAGLSLDARDSAFQQPLFSACSHGRLEVMRLMTSSGADTATRAQQGCTLLEIAAHHGRDEVVRYLLDEGADIEAADDEGWRAVHVAAAAGHLNVTKTLIGRGARIDGSVGNPSHAIHAAAVHGHVDVIDLLVACGADVDAKVRGITPLMIAAENNHAGAVACLLRNGANVGAVDEDGGTPLNFAASSENAEIVRLLLEAGADASNPNSAGFTPLHQAADIGRTRSVALLLEAGADPHALSQNGWSALQLAASKGYLDIVRLLLDRGSNPLACNSDGWSAAHSAVANGHMPVVQLLLDRNIDINAARTDGHTLLGQAAHTGNLELVQALLARGAEPTRTTTSGDTPLHCAAQDGHTAVVEALLAAGAPLESAAPQRGTPLLRATQYGKLEVARLLRERGADPGATWETGATLLHGAAQSGKLEVVAFALEHGGDIGSRTTTGETPLHYAAQNGFLPIVQRLLELGASPEDQSATGDTSLHYAAMFGRADVVRYLADHGCNIETANTSGWRPLSSAANNGHAEVVVELLRRGAAIDARKADGWTALMHAASHNHVDVVDQLLDAGADIEARLPSGETSLHIAATNGRPAAIARLLERGADITTRNMQGRTPLHDALVRGHAQVASTLIAAGAPVGIADAVDCTPLHYAVASGDCISAAQLIARGAEIEKRNNVGGTPLALACAANNAQLVQLLLLHGADPSARSGNDNTPLHLAALADAVAPIALLVEAGAELEAANRQGGTPLSIALEAGNTRSIAELERLGASRHTAEAALEAMAAARKDIMARDLAPHLSQLNISMEQAEAAFAAALTKLSLETAHDYAKIGEFFHSELVALGIPPAAAIQFVVVFLQVMTKVVHGAAEPAPDTEPTQSTAPAAMPAADNALMRALANLRQPEEAMPDASPFFERLAMCLERDGMTTSEAVATSEEFRERIYARILECLAEDRI